MLTITMVIPIILLIALIRVTKSPWRLGVFLLVLGPLVADFIVLVATIALKDVGPIPSIADFGSLVLMYYLLFLPGSIYPRGACIAALALLTSLVIRKYYAGMRSRPLRELLGSAVCGAVVGLVFAFLIFLAYKSPRFVDFVAHGDITERGLPPFYVSFSVLTGLIDGLLIALHSMRLRDLD